ncbi:uncharacterized protein LOC130710872 [Lotus japonicus]|uniref:uncharacterized protein LOC130710872 n=1 Tax=Lotus japonicus TaxID=34305 RepID=UPI002586565A|nr:uncharacterized protein LOC130710872 [Lotus japonicus]
MGSFADEPDFDLQGEENEILTVGGFETLPELDEDVWMVGVVLANHSVSVFGFKTVMRDLWQTRNCVDIRHAGQNYFIFKFTSPKDRDLVLKSGPWFFERHMLALNTYDGKGDPSGVPLTQVPFWIQIRGLPTTGRTEAVAKSLGKAFAGFLDWDKSEASKYGSFFRVRAWVRVDAPLRRGHMIAPEKGAPLKLRFKYEKLINFCYRCGRMDHVQKECGFEIPAGGAPFGPWLRADGDRYLIPRWRPGGERARDVRGEDLTGIGEGLEGGGEVVRVEGERVQGEGSGEGSTVGEGKGSDGVGASEASSEGPRVEGGGGEKGEGGEPGKEGRLKTTGAGCAAKVGNGRSSGGIVFNSPPIRGLRGGGRRGGTRGGASRLAGGDREYMGKDLLGRKRPCTPTSSGGKISPPLKKTSTDIGLGSAAAAEQPRPPQ